MAEKTSKLHSRILLLRWALPLAIFLMVSAYETSEHALLPSFHAAEEGNLFFFAAGVLIYGAIGPFVIWLVLNWIAHQVAAQLRDQEELERVHASLKQTYAQLQESTSYLSALHEISHSIASTVDLQEVTDQVVRAVAQITGARYACLRLLDDELGHWTHVSSSCQSELGGDAFLRILDDDLRLWHTGSRRAIKNTLPPVDLPEGREELSMVGVPVARGDNLIGAIHLCFPSPKSPTDSQINLLTTVADEIASAIEAAKLRTRHLQTIYEIDQTVRAEFNLDRLLEQILDKMIQLTSADAGTVMLVEETTGDLVLNSALGLPKEDLVQRLKTGDGELPWASAQVARTGTTLVVPDAKAETRWRSHLAVNGIQSVVSVPMVVSERVIGVISLGRRRRGAFGSLHLGLLSTIASQAGLVVRNVQLYNRAEELTIAEERNRIAREIHDGLAQNLAFLGLKADLCSLLVDKLALSGPDAERLARELSAIKEGLRENIRGARRSIFALHPLELERLGFVPALRKFAIGFGEQNGVSIQLSIAGDETSLPSHLEPPLFRAAQEMLNNVGKHAGASNVWINLDLADPEQFRLSVRDDGRGFDVGTLVDAPLRGHRGLAQMKERAASQGGTMSIDTAPGSGTIVEIRLPIKRQVAA